jgi:hypothetical protein
VGGARINRYASVHRDGCRVKAGIGSVTGDMLAGSVLIHWLARAKAAVTVSGYIAKARPSPRAAARRRIHSAGGRRRRPAFKVKNLDSPAMIRAREGRAAYGP